MDIEKRSIAKHIARLENDPERFFHELVKAVNKEFPDATLPGKIKHVFLKIDWTRTLIGLAGSVLVVLEYAEPGTISLLIP
jgi:hypothetical protein